MHAQERLMGWSPSSRYSLLSTNPVNMRHNLLEGDRLSSPRNPTLLKMFQGFTIDRLICMPVCTELDLCSRARRI